MPAIFPVELDGVRKVPDEFSRITPGTVAHALVWAKEPQIVRGRTIRDPRRTDFDFALVVEPDPRRMQVEAGDTDLLGRLETAN